MPLPIRAYSWMKTNICHKCKFSKIYMPFNTKIETDYSAVNYCRVKFEELSEKEKYAVGVTQRLVVLSEITYLQEPPTKCPYTLEHIV